MVFQAGLIRTDNGEFFIEPLERGQWEKEEDGRAHVVYRRSAIRQERTEAFKDYHNEGMTEETNTMTHSSYLGDCTEFVSGLNLHSINFKEGVIVLECL